MKRAIFASSYRPKYRDSFVRNLNDTRMIALVDEMLGYIPEQNRTLQYLYSNRIGWIESMKLNFPKPDCCRYAALIALLLEAFEITNYIVYEGYSAPPSMKVKDHDKLLQSDNTVTNHVWLECDGLVFESFNSRVDVSGHNAVAEIYPDVVYLKERKELNSSTSKLLKGDRNMQRKFTKQPTTVSAAAEVRTYRNNRNPNKHIEVKKANDGHSYARQYMEWDTPDGKVKNYTGAKDAKRGRYHRARKDTIDQMLDDYTEVEVTSADNSGDIQYSQVSFDFSYDGDYDATEVQNAVETALSHLVTEVLGVGFESVDYSGYPEYAGVSVSQCTADFSYFGDYDIRRIEDNISAELADCGCELVGIDFRSMNEQYK